MLNINKTLLYFVLPVLALIGLVPGHFQASLPPTSPSVTLLCYMNGDNDLSPEILHTLDMMEGVGASPQVNVVVLIDGHPDGLGPYGNPWSKARLVHLQADGVVGQINSPVIEEWGEADLGAADTLETFVRRGIELFPADRYMFYAFAHGQGIIDTQTLSHPQSGKTLSISRDTTNNSKMALGQFHQALYSGLGGHQFDLMVMFSCLTGMMEVGYTLSDITEYLVASEDEIRLLNQPPGSFQIRGLKVEEMIDALCKDPAIDARSLGHRLVDNHVQSYEKEAPLFADQRDSESVRYPGSMALLNCDRIPGLVQLLDLLAQELINNVDNPDIVDAIGRALYSSQPFASFLNLEYYDLADFIRRLVDSADTREIRTIGSAVLVQLEQHVVLYERHTKEREASGLSIYLSNPLVPQNIYEAHQAMYRNCRFGMETQWDEWIDVFRGRWQNRQSKSSPTKENQP